MASHFTGAVFDVAEVRFEHATVERGHYPNAPVSPIRILRFRFLDKHGNLIGDVSCHGPSEIDAPIALQPEEFG